MADTGYGIQGNNANQNDLQNEGTKTFTQEEVNAIVQDRLARERGKFSDYEDLKAKASKYDEMEEASKSELQKETERADALQKQLDQLNHENEIRGIRSKVATENGVPVDLLTADNEEDCAKQAEAILKFANKDGAYPSVKDGGEAKATEKKSNGQLFSDWLNEQIR